MDLASPVLKVLKKSIAQKIYQENFCVSLKNCKIFLLLNFCRLQYLTFLATSSFKYII